MSEHEETLCLDVDPLRGPGLLNQVPALYGFFGDPEVSEGLRAGEIQ